MRSLLDVHVLAARRDTWLGADRPLRDDELVSLGLAVRMFGYDAAMPLVVRDAARSITDELARGQCTAIKWRRRPHTDRSLSRVSTSSSGCAEHPGRTRRYERSRVCSSRSTLPPWITAERALVARPSWRRLARSAKRLAEAVSRLSAKRETTRDE